MSDSPKSGDELFIVDNSDEVETPQVVKMESSSLREIRLKVEKHIKNTCLKQVQAPVGVKPVLKCWMELN